MKKAIISFDFNPNYSFYAPLSSLLWKTIGYSPVNIIIGKEEDWKNNVVFCALKEIEAEVRFVKPHDAIPNATIAQVSRLYAFLEEEESTYVITSDVDMFPMSKKWFNQQDWTKKLHLFSADAYDHRTYPMCYIGAYVPVWREIMAESGDIRTITIKNINLNGLDQPQIWNYDERLFASKIFNWSGYTKDCHMIIRNKLTNQNFGDRIDRSNWNTSCIDTALDAHLPRPGYNEHWEKISNLLGRIMDNDKYKWACEYRNKYIREKNG